MSTDDPLYPHRQRLLQRRRCPQCAEQVPPRTILAGADCPHCGAPLRLAGAADHAEEVLAAIRSGWSRARVPVYAGVLVAAFLAGWIPWLSTAVTAVAMVLANIMLIRRPLKWLPAGRRTLTRFLLRVWLFGLVLVSILLNTVAAALIPALGAGAVLSAVIGLFTTFLYVEGALMAVERGIRAVRT